MMEIYRRALQEVGYKATRFLQMLHEHRGVMTARILLEEDAISDGYTALWEHNRLDLTVEAMIIDHPEYHQLFNADELARARRRLCDSGYESPTDVRAMPNEEELLNRITVEEGKCGGKPCIRRMRIRVVDVLGMLAAGMTREEILADYPYLEPDDIAACLVFAARSIDGTDRAVA